MFARAPAICRTMIAALYLVLARTHTHRLRCGGLAVRYKRCVPKPTQIRSLKRKNVMSIRRLPLSQRGDEQKLRAVFLKLILSFYEPEHHLKTQFFLALT